ncbi:hypothetical protein AQ910_10310 [Burkholderia pseudomallei]|nr:hypothetical protein BGI49_30890 [Burkholderia pseudomallei]APZ16882.1 hypothetical protein BGI52_31015 [Burkholderia pseudomallei]OMW17635.1 hypothetical protein AQ806_22735 [Burkholderia pseudomallei]OMW51946.1 hypothetical protein AQ811_09915 [Burkholderia pseudomallei]OMZ32418.1 hypothetical protein AQ861_01585 [Burkholderia pseudomallei]
MTCAIRVLSNTNRRAASAAPLSRTIAGISAAHRAAGDKRPTLPADDVERRAPSRTSPMPVARRTAGARGARYRHRFAAHAHANARKRSADRHRSPTGRALVPDDRAREHADERRAQRRFA